MKHKIYNSEKVIENLQDPDGWTVENNPHKAPDYMRMYPDKNGFHWIDYFEYFRSGEMICHSCIIRAKYGSGNCLDGGEYFQCVESGKRAKLRKKYEYRKSVQSTLW
mgnify:CR=1 FL=1